MLASTAPMEAPQDAVPTRARLARLAWLLDNSIPVPGTGYRFGLDAVLGLVPALGDAVGVILSSYIVLEAARLGAPAGTLLRMVFNIAVEGLIGMIPLAGDLFDAAWKANQRNVALLDSHCANPEGAAAAGQAFGRVLLALLGALVFLLSVFAYFLAYWFWTALKITPLAA